MWLMGSALILDQWDTRLFVPGDLRSAGIIGGQCLGVSDVL
jgi:hypothetical protein